jgi:hypothetical protein
LQPESPGRHRERSEAIQDNRAVLRPWIASSLALLAMTWTGDR